MKTQSSWEWTVARSNYHFDDTRRDGAGEWFFHCGRFEGDWSKELTEVLSKTHTVTWANRKNYKGELREPPQLEEELYDLRSAGIADDLPLTDRVDNVEDYPIFKQMMDTLEMTNVRPQFHIQRTGQMFNRHIDKLYEYNEEDPSKIMRFHIMLEDWRPGQFMCYGTYHYSHWKRGDISWFDWQNLPHATANASHHPRCMLQVTGIASARTIELSKQSGVIKL